MLPKSKYKMVRSLKVSTEIPKGLNGTTGMEIGVNISNPYEISQENDTLFLRGRLFFERQEMARACLDTKKMVPHPFEKGEKVPARYRLGTIKMLHVSFEAETGVKCSLECFRQNIPFNLICPKPNDWGTSLCVRCINPEMKLRHSPISQKIPHFITKMENLTKILMDLLRELRPLILTKRPCITSGRGLSTKELAMQRLPLSERHFKAKHSLAKLQML